MGADLAACGDPIAFQSRLRPNALAIRSAENGRELSYQQFHCLINRLAGALSGIVAKPLSARIAVLGRNSIEQVALAMACQRVGAIFVPLNWRLSGVELARILADCEPVLLLVDDEFEEAARIAAHKQTRVLMRLRGPFSFAEQTADDGWTQHQAPDGNAACALLYTSGTTGQPKGVVVTRSGAFAAALNMALVGEINARAVMLCDVPLFHTVGLFAVARATLTLGGFLVLSEGFTPALTLERLSNPIMGLTHYFGVPQIAAALLAEPAFLTADLSRLKAIFVGGAPLPKFLVDAYLERGVVLVNGYGMTEAGTVIHMPLDVEATRGNPGAIGYPAPCVAIRLADEDGVDVAPGEAGEIWVSGPAVTPGYWCRPEANAESFRNGWFRTGDVARVDPDGLYHLLDRRKDMYISGGENVYPAEVESVLLAHPQITEAAIVGVPDDRWGETGVAFVVARPGSIIEEDGVLAACRERLARYKHPAQVEFIDILPRTAAGKVQKDLLRARFLSR